MVLDKIDVYLLNAIYEKDYQQKEIQWEELGFESVNHKAFHLLRLEQYNLIKLGKNALIFGGHSDLKYGVAYASIWNKDINITNDGINYLKNKNIIV